MTKKFKSERTYDSWPYNFETNRKLEKKPVLSTYSQVKLDYDFIQNLNKSPKTKARTGVLYYIPVPVYNQF